MGRRPQFIRAPVFCALCHRRFTDLPRHLRVDHNLDSVGYQARVESYFGMERIPVIELTDAFEVIAGRVQLLAGAKRADGRDADKAREYQRRYRAGLVGPRSRPPDPPRSTYQPGPPIDVAALVARYFRRSVPPESSG